MDTADGDILLRALARVGLECRLRFSEDKNPELFRDPKPFLVAVIAGGVLGSTHAFLTAKGQVCKIANWIELADGRSAIPDSQKAVIFDRLLALNHEIPFGRISMTSRDVEGLRHKSIIVYAETMFFWRLAESQCRDLFEIEVTTRLGELVNLFQRMKGVIESGSEGLRAGQNS